MRLLASVIAAAFASTAALGILLYGDHRPPSAAATATASQEPTAVDIGFAQSMSRHHLQAIVVAQLMLDGRPTPLAGLARSIAWTQTGELGEMRGWLRLWNQPVFTTARGMDWMLLGRTPPAAELAQYLLDCRGSSTGMAGLASDADVDRLRRLQGPARDAHFLGLMLAHHRGALPMARFAATNARLPAVRQLASRIALDQSEEIVRILRTQAAMAASTAD